MNKARYGFVIDVSRCIDCRACLVACRAENDVPLGYTRIRVHDSGVAGEFPAISRMFVPANCMHCDEPPCVEVCPSGATYKDPQSGLVLVDQEACIGCGLCVEACPYEARYQDPRRGVVDKCNACQPRLERGEQPACVATCLGGARMFGDLNDSQSEVSRALARAGVSQRLVTEETDPGPNIYYVNGDLRTAGLAPRAPRYTAAETFWRKATVPVVLGALAVSFLGQAAAFTRQLLTGEKEFDE